MDRKISSASRLDYPFHYFDFYAQCLSLQEERASVQTSYFFLEFQKLFSHIRQGKVYQPLKPVQLNFDIDHLDYFFTFGLFFLRKNLNVIVG
jgi:hypothetical protein